MSPWVVGSDCSCIPAQRSLASIAAHRRISAEKTVARLAATQCRGEGLPCVSNQSNVQGPGKYAFADAAILFGQGMLRGSWLVLASQYLDIPQVQPRSPVLRPPPKQGSPQVELSQTA